MKKIDIIGQEFESKSGSKYVVLEYLYNVSTEYYYKIRFLETDKVKIAEKDNIRKGHVKDDYKKTIYGVACRGNESSRYPEINKLAYKRWYAMIERCYNKNAFSYKSYGAKGVTVSPEWLCFENFFKDLPDIPGYDEKEYISGELQLDKDTILEGNKTYSKETCVFLSRSKNAKNQPSKKKRFIATNPNGEQFVFFQQIDCAERFGLTARTIGKVLDGHLKSHKGWKFRYEV